MNNKEVYFIKLNLKTKKFSATQFFTGKVIFKNEKYIPYNKDQVIIYTGNGNNIHPSLWQNDWFLQKDLK